MKARKLTLITRPAFRSAYQTCHIHRSTITTHAPFVTVKTNTCTRIECDVSKWLIGEKR